MKRKCLICGSAILGRIDKKFCSDQCRNRYHNGLKYSEYKFIRQVHYKLRKNRRIILELTQSGKEKVEARVLLRAGFDFDYLTYKTRIDGDLNCFFCYDLGYFWMPDRTLTLIRRKFADEL